MTATIATGRAAAVALAPGDKVGGRFVVAETLGSGGMATAYLAQDLERGDTCVLKELALERATASGQSDPWKLVELFEREARVLSRIDHPRVPKLRAHFRQEDEGRVRLYLAEDRVAGRSLAVEVREGRRWNEREIVRLGIELARILAHLHTLRPAVVHRDIKPSNVILDADGAPHLIDFGAVRDEILAERRRAGHTVVGTWGYVPPEQLAGQGGPRADLYALGATLLHALSHKDPAAMVGDDARLDFEPHVQVSPGLAAILRKLTERRPAARYPSARALITDLERLIAGVPPAKTRSRREIADAARKRARALLLLLPLLFVTGAFADRFIDLSAKSFDTGRDVDALAFSRAGDLFAAATADRRLVVRDAREGAGWDRLLELKTATRLDGVAFSPDGTQLAALLRSWDEDTYRHTRSSVIVVDVRTGEIHRSLWLGAPRGDSLAFSPDGSRLAVAANRWDDREKTETTGELRVFHVLGGEPPAERFHLGAVIAEGKRPYFQVGFHPKTGALVYVTRSWNDARARFDPARVVARATPSGPEEVLYRGPTMYPPAWVFSSDGERAAFSNQSTEEAMIVADGKRIPIGEPPAEYSYRPFVPGAFSKDGTRFYFPISRISTLPWNWLPGARGQANTVRWIGEYDAGTGELLRRHRVRGGIRTQAVGEMAASVDGRLLAVGFGDLYAGGIKIWGID